MSVCFNHSCMLIPWTARKSNLSVLKEINPEYHWKDWCWCSNILAPIFAKSWLFGKDLVAGKDWGQQEKRVTEDEMVGWHHQLKGRKFEQTLGDRDREAWCAIVHGIAKSQTWLSDWTTTQYVIYSKATKTKLSCSFPSGFHPQCLQLHINLPFLETPQIAKVPWLPGSDSPYWL